MDDNGLEVHWLLDRNVGVPILVLIIFGLLFKGNDKHLAFGSFGQLWVGTVVTLVFLLTDNGFILLLFALSNLF